MCEKVGQEGTIAVWEAFLGKLVCSIHTYHFQQRRRHSKQIEPQRSRACSCENDLGLLLEDGAQFVRRSHHDKSVDTTMDFEKFFNIVPEAPVVYP